MEREYTHLSICEREEIDLHDIDDVEQRVISLTIAGEIIQGETVALRLQGPAAPHDLRIDCHGLQDFHHPAVPRQRLGPAAQQPFGIQIRCHIAVFPLHHADMAYSGSSLASRPASSRV